MSAEFSGEEPALSGVFDYTEATGNEPWLGGEKLVELFRQHMLARLHKPNLSHLKRAEVGEWLDEHGDTRPGVGLREDGLPDIVWCPVRPGLQTIRGVEEPQIIESVSIAKYPVTWAQYRVFLESPDGHEDPRWWVGLRRRDEYPRADLLKDNYPAQEISWYDAVAYSRWLSNKLGYEVRLPTEWEWQRAANDADPDRIYPWGRYFDRWKANTRESGLRHVSAVGMYPAGEAPCGALDMCGTVLEWCANSFNDPQGIANEPIFMMDYLAEYELILEEERIREEQRIAALEVGDIALLEALEEKELPAEEAPESGGGFVKLRDYELPAEIGERLWVEGMATALDEDIKRVVRGGSWFSYHRYALTIFRSGHDAFQRYNSVGFRLLTEHEVYSG